MSDHTPGPWYVLVDGARVSIRKVGSNVPICVFPVRSNRAQENAEFIVRVVNERDAEAAASAKEGK